MYVERRLLKACMDINLVNNKRNLYHKLSYIHNNKTKSKISSSLLESNIAPLLNEYDFQGTTYPEEKEEYNGLFPKTINSKMHQTISNIKKTLYKLENLTGRNWNIIDMKKQNLTCSLKQPKKSVIDSNQRQAIISNAINNYKEGPNTLPCSNSKSNGRNNNNKKAFTIRIYNPKLGRYIDNSVIKENFIQKIIYNRLKAGSLSGAKSDLNSFNGANTINNQEIYHGVKDYTANNETYKSSWIDKGNFSPSFNYESSAYNLINNAELPSKRINFEGSSNSKIYHKLKSISEYYDFTRVTASRHNKEFLSKFRKCPKLFKKISGICTNQCSLVKSFGPFCKMYEKNINL